MDFEVLLQCRVCGGKVSSGALACPHCGSRNFKPLDFLKKEEEERRIKEEAQRARYLIEEKERRDRREKQAAEERAKKEKEKEEIHKKAEEKGSKVSVVVVKKSTWNGRHDEYRDEWHNLDKLKIDGKQRQEMLTYDGYSEDIRIKPGFHTAHYEEWDGWGHLVESEQSFTTTATTKRITIFIL